MDMKLTIREEVIEDYSAVEDLIVAAFKNAEHTDHQEQELVKRLRDSDSFIPELSLVAEVDGDIVGHILLTKVHINGDAASYDSLALAPVSVLPLYQGKGIGGELIKRAHEIARCMGYGSVILLGHKDYYPRFGYRVCKEFGISLPFEVPEEYCMAIELIEDSLKEVSGVVEYDPAFNG